MKDFTRRYTKIPYARVVKTIIKKITSQLTVNHTWFTFPSLYQAQAVTWKDHDLIIHDIIYL